MKNRSLPAQLVSGVLLAVVTFALTACGQVIYKEPAYNYSGRPIPPSGLLQRVMVAYTGNGSSGGLEILDGLRDLRTNVQNTIPGFFISGFSAAQPTTIINYPEQTTGYVLSYTDGSVVSVNYSKESSNGSVAGFGAYTPSVAASPDGTRFAGAAEAAGILGVGGSLGSVSLNLPNVYKAVINRGNSIILAMVRNSNTLYRVVKLPASNNPIVPPGSVDCEPLLLPLYCVVPVKGTYDRPTDAYFSTDGNSVYILNCGPECGGTTAGVTVLNAGALVVDNVPTVDPLSPAAPSPMQTLPVANPVPIPGGATVAQSDGSNLYLAGQQLVTDVPASGTTPAVTHWAGRLTTLNLSTYVPNTAVSISDGTHTKMLFADDNTLWVGSQQCASGERAYRASLGVKDQSANYNCLTRVVLGSSNAPQIVPAAVTGGATVPYPNGNQNPYYYGSLTGICWVQQYHKVYTAYGGQVHVFNTADGSEIDNTNITVQGTVLDVAYMDALTNAAN